MAGDEKAIEAGGRVRAHVRVTGSVQGVFFRSGVRSQAKLLEIRGWVRNVPDSSLEAVFEGDRDRVRKMIDFCWEGPPGAQVRKVEVEWEKPRHDTPGFEIK